MRLPAVLSAVLRAAPAPNGTDAPRRSNGASGARDRLRLQAEALAARLPALVAEADRVASTVAAGVHGRRRAGSGDSFWQYRQLMPGESITRIDWRQSARTSRAYVRETEWEAAQTVCLWRDGSPSMAWRSADTLPTKRERAELLLLALAMLLLRGGEHVRLLGTGAEPAAARFSGRQAAERLARALGADETGHGGDHGLPAAVELSRHARLVLIGDFLAPLPEIEAGLAAFAGVPVTLQLVQLLDPAELELPYAGRVRFEGTEGEAPQLVPRAQDVRHAYVEALAAQQAGLARLCAAGGFGLLRARTDQRPETALLALHQALGG